ncbi:hypothetical protein RIF29_20505 [Crotalaria pallida]|uniref:Uncharacterized protein n=1 Tax=Crotalaria pallida TaxID=3830 RepID=A0AAN9F4M6_CROPI
MVEERGEVSAATCDHDGAEEGFDEDRSGGDDWGSWVMVIRLMKEGWLVVDEGGIKIGKVDNQLSSEIWKMLGIR